MKTHKIEEIQRVSVDTSDTDEHDDVEDIRHKDILPPTIGRKYKPGDDGKIRDCWGELLD